MTEKMDSKVVRKPSLSDLPLTSKSPRAVYGRRLLVLIGGMLASAAICLSVGVLIFVLSTPNGVDHGDVQVDRANSLLLLLIVIVVLIIIGRVLTRETGTLAAVTASAVASIFTSLRALIVVLLAILLVLALVYTGWDNG